MNYRCDECETDMVRDPVLSAIDPRHDVHQCLTCGAFLVVKTDGTDGTAGTAGTAGTTGTAGPIGTLRLGKWTDAPRTDGTARPLDQ